MTKAELVHNVGEQLFLVGKGSKAGGFQWAQFGGHARMCTVADLESYLEAICNPIYRGVTLPIPDEVDDPTMILQALSNSLNYTSCGLWNGTRPGTKSFADVHLRFLGVAPSHPILAADFRRSMRNLQEIAFGARAKETDTLS